MFPVLNIFEAVLEVQLKFVGDIVSMFPVLNIFQAVLGVQL